jgi:hypothetical protein
VHWVHFIHNKINVSLGKPELTLIEALEAYKRLYVSAPVVAFCETRHRRRWLLLAMTLCALSVAIYFGVWKKRRVLFK